MRVGDDDNNNAMDTYRYNIMYRYVMFGDSI